MPCCEVKTCLSKTGGEGCLVFPCFKIKAGPALDTIGEGTFGDTFLGPRDEVTAPYWVCVELAFSCGISLDDLPGVFARRDGGGLS